MRLWPAPDWACATGAVTTLPERNLMIKFLCPNGHPLSTNDDRAGTPAKCPKCQVPLVVPMASETGNGEGAVAAPGSGSQVAGQSGSQKSTAPETPAEKTPAPAGDVIVFLCPNGHRLNGPARLKGKAGQCPHCNAKFRIPDDDEEEEVEHFEEVDDVETAESMTDEEFAAEDIEDIDEISEFTEDDEYGEAELEPFEEAPATVIDAFTTPPPEGVHPYASIIAMLWEAKEPGQVIDLHLQKGEVFTPELFAEALAQPYFGIFGRREKEGGHTLIMIPWDQITRIEVRNVKQVPVGLFH
jgi:hypothetical protein